MDKPEENTPAPIRAEISTMGVERNWPRNCWWVVAHRSELAERPISRWVMEEPLALYRRADGEPVALHDRCPHRWAPLHKGEVCGDNLVCPYHGAEFGPSGGCSRVPTQANIPAALKVRAFPVVERYSFIWVWTGDPERADPELIPRELSCLDHPDWHMAWGYKAVDANYMQLKENVLDLTHFAFLHKNSLKVTDWDQPPAVAVTNERVTYRQIFEMAPLAPVYALPAGKPVGKLANRDSWGAMLSPAVNMGAVDMHDPQPGPEGNERFSLRIIHLTTPVSTGKSHYYWAMARDHGEPFDCAETRAQADIVFGEDIGIVELVQSFAQRAGDMHAAVEVSFIADQAALQARRKIQSLIDKERS